MMFRGKFHPGSRRINLTADDVHAILYPKRTAHKARDAVALAQLISALAQALEAEIPALMPDYLLGHRIAWTLLRDVKTAVEPDMPEWLGPEYIKTEYQLPFVVGYIMRSLSGDSRHNFVATRALLNKAAKVYLNSLGGGVEDNEPRSQVKNKIAMLEAATKMRKVEPDSPGPLTEQDVADLLFGTDSDSDFDDDDDDDDGYDVWEGDSGLLPSRLGQGVTPPGFRQQTRGSKPAPPQREQLQREQGQIRGGQRQAEGRWGASGFDVRFEANLRSHGIDPVRLGQDMADGASDAPFDPSCLESLMRAMPLLETAKERLGL